MRLRVSPLQVRLGGLVRPVAIVALAFASAAGSTMAGPAQPALAFVPENTTWSSPTWYYQEYSSYGGIDMPSYATSAIASAVSAWNSSPTAATWDNSAGYSGGANVTIRPMSQTEYNNFCPHGCGGWEQCDQRTTNNNGATWTCHQATIALWFSNTAMSQGSPNYNASDVEHEMGHVMGLDHDCVWGSLMYVKATCSNQSTAHDDYDESTSPVNPSQDDISGVNSIYPYHPTSGNGGGCAGIYTPHIQPPNPELGGGSILGGILPPVNVPGAPDSDEVLATLGKAGFTAPPINLTVPGVGLKVSSHGC